ncbi:MAG TPA: 2Fe-2S iron-sulfur cluster-binding protein [Actinomycetota bacterium]|nr:2Fe-2S iron-sulfur cluster-binding protein [Actinomycetota bacterium]
MTPGPLRFEGRDVPVADGDTVASALFRAGVRTFSRSVKGHRRRGLYCGTGECPNCMVTVDGVPGVRSCVTPAAGGMRIERGRGWPSAEHDLLHVADLAHPLMPVGFYLKTFIRPRFAWRTAERLIRRATGAGRLPADAPAARTIARNVRCDTIVVGAGIAGLTASLEASASGERVLLCDGFAIGSRVAPGPTLDAIRALETRVRASPAIEVLEGHQALGLYDGPTVPLAGPNELVRVRADRVVVATGATETHQLFPGNDLPGVWLGRAASSMAAVHGVSPGRRVVVVASTDEGVEHLDALVTAGTAVVAAVVPAAFVDRVPRRAEAIVDGELVEARGHGRLRSVIVRERGERRRIACDALVLSMGLSPRDDLARMAVDESLRLVGDAALDADEPRLGGGYLCLCEDVAMHDAEQAWAEGFRSAEILKRYTTATMGPCRGAMCGRALACFARDRADAADVRAGTRTTARPPVWPVTLETLAAPVHEVIEKRTGLHETHVAAGAAIGWSSGWKRPMAYADPREEYRAVRERVGVMDVGTLARFLIAGRDARALVDAVFAGRVDDLEPGRSRYVLALDERGYVVDDGLLCVLEDGAYLLTSTTGGAERMDARLREWAERLGLHVHLLDRTSELGAILVAGPRARDLLAGLTDDPVDAAALPYPGHRELTVAGVRCRAIRSGFVGELAFELHHPRSAGPGLWATLLREGRDAGISPFGLDALELLRLEKGHAYLGQDTLPDDTPAKLGLSWAVDATKPWFVGKAALERLAELPPTRRLTGLVFEDAPSEASELRGAPLSAGGAVVGRVTSAGRSPALDRAIGLGWIRRGAEGFPDELRAGGAVARVTRTPFYDPEGARLRG